MSARLRFNTAQQVIEAFPAVFADIDLQPGDETSIEFARKLLVAARGFDAITYVACLLPRREAVWWGCQCVRAISDNKVDDFLLAAEAWVREPEEASRRAALKLGASGNMRTATTWLALATGHSGGSVAPEESLPVAASPDATAIDVKVAVVLAIVRRPLPDQPAWVSACIEAGVRFAEGGDAKVRAPALAVAPAVRG
jgi:hypothetical protein